jgi:hypothetical protein
MLPYKTDIKGTARRTGFGRYRFGYWPQPTESKRSQEKKQCVVFTEVHKQVEFKGTHVWDF